ncbi:MAG: DUF3305 domain-containing protein [Gammaproteobacteria bacterium]|nr:MAG: DUF3305 domain-containing protein [Gammaproteobacteria bacterium]
MQEIELADFNHKLPEKLPISVIMEKRPSDHAWVNFTYQAIGVVVDAQQQGSQVKKIHEQDGVEQYLFPGLSVRLHVDECESYYHNLMSPKPGCYIIASEPETLDEMPEPYLVSLSFDEAHAYLEGDAEVYAVEIPAELYRWTEAFILMHYVATRKSKRKLKNWSEQPEGKTTVSGKSP